MPKSAKRSKTSTRALSSQQKSPSITSPVPSQLDSDQQPQEDKEPENQQTDDTIESVDDRDTENVDNTDTATDRDILRMIMTQLTNLTQRMTIMESDRTSINEVTPLRMTTATKNQTPVSNQKTTPTKVTVASKVS